MNKEYWEKLAPQHSEEIFSVFENDRNTVISKAIKRFASPRKTAVDLGCAVGDWLPLLSSSFKKVFAVDISENYISLATQRHQHLGNIEFVRADISNAGSRLPRFHFALCVNAMMMPAANSRQNFLKAIYESLYTKGHLALVVPSLESAMLAEYLIAEVNQRNGISPGTALEKDPAAKLDQLKMGIVDLDSVPYKHYLKEELEFLLYDLGFTLISITKVLYGWETEMEDPPDWLPANGPWDWLVLARKP